MSEILYIHVASQQPLLQKQAVNAAVREILAKSLCETKPHYFNKWNKLHALTTSDRSKHLIRIVKILLRTHEIIEKSVHTMVAV